MANSLAGSTRVRAMAELYDITGTKKRAIMYNEDMARRMVDSMQLGIRGCKVTVIVLYAC